MRKHENALKAVWVASGMVAAALAIVALVLFIRRPAAEHLISNSSRQPTFAVPGAADSFDRPAPALQALGTDGKSTTVSFDAYPVTALVFLEATCSRCAEQLSKLEAVRNAAIGMQLVVIMVKDVPAHAASVADATGFHGTMLSDENEHAASAYRIATYPSTIFVRRGLIEGIAVGVLDSGQFHDRMIAVAALP